VGIRPTQSNEKKNCYYVSVQVDDGTLIRYNSVLILDPKDRELNNFPD